MLTRATDDVEAARNRDARFFRWALPLAVAIAVTVGGTWWSITLRQVREPLARLRDGKREIVVAADGRSGAFRSLPPAMRDSLAETLRSGKIPIPPTVNMRGADGSASWQELPESRRAELDEWTRAAGGSHLILSMANARAGLLDVAERELRALSEQNPASPLVRQLLEQVEAHGNVAR